MKRWKLMPDHFGYRVEFKFVNGAGTLLKSKTWELRRERTTPARTFLLQANAKLLPAKPTIEELGENYVAITTAVSEIDGELATKTFDGFHTPDLINRQIAMFSFTLGVVLDSRGLHLTMHTASPKI